MNKILFIALIFFTNSIQAQFRLQEAFPNLDSFYIPMELINAGDGSNRMFLAERLGKISVFKNIPTATKKTFIDLSSLLTGEFGELLGFAFHPNYENNGYVYASLCFNNMSGIYWRIIRFTKSSTNADSALFSSIINVLTFQEPQEYHNGGKMQFGSDGYLYFSTGDGGNGGILSGNKTSLNGKIIRIDINNLQPYSIPVTNPYYNNNLGYRQEIYASGFRNPWKFSFDYDTDLLWCADVGHHEFEEVNLIESGKDYGWNKMEGFACFGICDTTGRGFTRPIYAYAHNGERHSITGGYVYRGQARPELSGKYIYGDFEDGKIYSLTYDGINPPVNNLILNTDIGITTFGITEDNELYVCDIWSGIYKFYGHHRYGDVNGDGVVNLQDLILVYNDAVNFISGITDTDVNSDGFVNLNDLVIVYNLTLL